MKRFGPVAMVAVLVVGLAGGGGVMWLITHSADDHAEHADAGGAAAGQYYCPMHPTIVSDHPGKCPICGMKLILRDKPAASAERKILFYRSPHDPKVTSHVPMKDAMGMDFLPVYEGETGGRSSVQGMAAVDIDPARQQLIGLRTAKVETGEVSPTLRTTGRVAVDETRVEHVSIKVDGFVEKVFVDFVGKPVRKGEPLFTLYSPELVSVQSEYLLAVKTRNALREAGGSTEQGDALVASARQRLRLWDISERDVAALERTGDVRQSMTVYSPAAGVVTVKEIVEGHKLTAGDMPYEITDLSQVWVLADAYESDLARVKPGMTAKLKLNAYPDRLFEGTVTFIDPVLDPSMRTAKLRLSFANPTGELRPELFGEVVLQGTPRVGLRIPADAVIDSGQRKVVFVAAGDGKFAPREVKLGATAADQVEVLQGLKEGEEVVTRANFLIDSESRLRASLQALEEGAK